MAEPIPPAAPAPTAPESGRPAAPSGGILAWLRLLRAPIVFTAASNPLAACLSAVRWNDPIPWEPLALLLPGSACLGMAGMALNDYFDRQRDAERRPSRPIPSGAIPAESALAAGLALLVIGVGLAFAASRTSGLLAAASAGFILLYDAALKDWGTVGAWSLGLARCANACAGLALAPSAARLLDSSWAARTEWFYPVLLLLLIQSLTQLSRLEDDDSPPASRQMSVGVYTFLLMIGPWVLQAKVALGVRKGYPGAGLAYAALGLLSLLLVVRLIPALRDPSEARIRGLVGTALLALLLFDAAAILSSGHLLAGLAVAASLPAAWLFGRRIAIT